MKSLEDQIKCRCVHFNGIMNDACKAGIAYADVREGKPYKFPCFKDSGLTCDKSKFLTDEEVAEELKTINESTGRSVGLMVAAKNHYDKTKQAQSKFKCPMGDHEAFYTRASTNGHFWIKCSTCDISLMQ